MSLNNWQVQRRTKASLASGGTRQTRHEMRGDTSRTANDGIDRVENGVFIDEQQGDDDSSEEGYPGAYAISREDSQHHSNNSGNLLLEESWDPTLQAGTSAAALDEASSRVVVLMAQDQSEKLDEQKSKKINKRSVLFVSVLSVIVVVGAIIGASIVLLEGAGRRSASGTSALASTSASPSSAPPHDLFSNACAMANATSAADMLMTERYVQLRSLIEERFPNTIDTLNISSSPHRLALCWISDIDTFQSASLVNEERIVQRFLLAVLYFSWVKKSDLLDAGATNVFRLPTFQSWLSSEVQDECDWDHVKCTTSNDRKVIELDLWDAGLVGRIPSDLSLLSTLTSIDLSYNRLTGEIPLTLWSMTQLTSLILNFNDLNGTIPQEAVTKLYLLESFGLASNQLTGTLPPVWNLPNLTQLMFGSNRIRGRLPDLSASANLALVDISMVGLNGTIPKHLWSLTKLGRLNAFHTSMSGTLSSQIGLMQKLSYLDLSANFYFGTIPSELGRLEKLESLNLRGNEFSGSIPREVCLFRLNSTKGDGLGFAVDADIACDCCHAND